MKQIQEIIQVPLGRKRIVYEHEVQATTPARAELQKTVAKLQKTEPALVTINQIKSVYGTGKVVITADVYGSKEDYKKSVPAYLSKKSVVKEEPKPVEEAKEEVKSAEAPAEEKPAEEAKQEAPPAEEKPQEAEKPAEAKKE